MSHISHIGCSVLENEIASTRLHPENTVRFNSIRADSITDTTNIKVNLACDDDSCPSSDIKLRASRSEDENMRNIEGYKLTNTNITTFTCSTCSKHFLSKSALIRHVFNHMPDAPKPGDICELCGEVFQSAVFLQKHVVSFHVGKSVRNGALMGQDGGKHTAHSVCDESFEQPPKKKQRCIDTSQNLLYCTLCDKAFLHLDSLRKHYMTHTGEKPYRCDTCGKTFVQKGLLGKHQFIHTGIQPYACNSCPERFITTQALRQHTLVHAAGNGTVYNCEMCGIPFAEHAGLRRHWMSHSGEDPYQCDICRKSFAHPGHLRMHRLGHLEQSYLI